MKKPLGLETKLIEEMQVNNLHFLFQGNFIPVAYGKKTLKTNSGKKSSQLTSLNLSCTKKKSYLQTVQN